MDKRHHIDIVSALVSVKDKKGVSEPLQVTPKVTMSGQQ